MNQAINLKTINLGISRLIRPPIAGCGFFLLALAVIWCALSPRARAAEGDVGNGSVAEGSGALASQTSGSFNTALGLEALFSNTTGFYNTGTGAAALYHNTGGAYNTADGLHALFSNTSGTSNTATGLNALFSNTTASYNTADGVNALYSNTTGTYNTATGLDALYSNTTGSQNTATGDYALLTNTTGGNNTAYGLSALFSNTIGSFNTASSDYALYSNTEGINNTAVGHRALFASTGNYNTALGAEAGTDPNIGSNNIYIGDTGFPGDNNVIAIGAIAASGTALTKCFIGGIYGRPAGASPLAVMCGTDGQLSANASSRRFKHDIKPIDKTSEAIVALKPVSFRYNNDSTNTPWFGLIAEDVALVSEDLIVRDKEGKPFGVRYEEVSVLLLNEFLKAHKKIEAQDRRAQEQDATITQLKVTVAQQQKRFEATAAEQEKEIRSLVGGLSQQAAQIQKVSDQLEMSKVATKLVGNNQ